MAGEGMALGHVATSQGAGVGAMARGEVANAGVELSQSCREITRSCWARICRGAEGLCGLANVSILEHSVLCPQGTGVIEVIRLRGWGRCRCVIRATVLDICKEVIPVA